MGTSASRTDKWWEARYAKSQQRVDQAHSAAPAELPIPHVPAVSTVIGRDGSQFMLRLIAPGEPLDNVGRFAVAATLMAFLSRGQVTHRVDNPSWIAVVDRQRGPWRGYERVDVHHFDHYSDAAHFLQGTRLALESNLGAVTPPAAGRAERTTVNDEETNETAGDTAFVPVTFDHFDHVRGPFYHGTKTSFEVGTQLVPGQASNFQEGRVSNNVYFSALVETAAWGAELATALAGTSERGHIYVVEPTGPFEDDPNVTNKRFPGNVTQSYRTRHPLRVVGELERWEGHAPEVLAGMLANLARLREQGLDIIED